MIKQVTTIGLIEVRGYDLEQVQEEFNREAAEIQGKHPGRFAGLDVFRVSSGASWHLRGILQFQTTMAFPDPEPGEGQARQKYVEAQERSLTKILSIASNVSMMREAGKHGERVDYRRLWELIDALGVEFRTMGAIVGDGDQVAETQAPPEAV